MLSKTFQSTLSADIINACIPIGYRKYYGETRKQKSNVSEFVERLQKATGYQKEQLFIELTFAYLNNVFEIIFYDHDYLDVFIEPAEKDHILFENDIMFRLIRNNDLIEIFSEAVLGMENRFYGMGLIYGYFKKRKLFACLNYIQADIFHTLFLLRFVDQYLNEKTINTFNALIKDFPFSITGFMMDDIKRDAFFLCEHELLSCDREAGSVVYFFAKPKLIELMADSE